MGNDRFVCISHDSARMAVRQGIARRRVTVLHNGVLVQNHTEIKGSTHYDQENKYAKHAERLPLVLMYHGNPVRFRNIWIREIKELEGKPKEGK